MKILFHVGGMPFDGGTLREGASLGGSESAGYYLARELAQMGHEVVVFTNSRREGQWEGVGYMWMGHVDGKTPLGAVFESLAKGQFCDAIIGQRHPHMFAMPFGSEVNIWHTHDLALSTMAPHVGRQLWNLDAVACVSKWHCGQVAQVYGLPPKLMHVVRNGVDGELFGECDSEAKRNSKVVLYSHRPERGLGRFLEIAEAMHDSDLEFHFAWYANIAEEMRPLYNALMTKATRLRNVRFLGHLSKEALANAMKACWVHLYPTEFEEVSCITAMEQQHAGTPVLTTRVGALPETLEDAGVYWLKDASVQTAVAALKRLRKESLLWDKLHAKALTKREQYNWHEPAQGLVALIQRLQEKKRDDPGRLARHLMRMSDIVPLQRLLAEQPEEGLVATTKAEYEECYAFLKGDLGEFYRAVYEHEAAKGVDHGVHCLQGENRYDVVQRMLSSVPEDAAVLDYGCAHGHYTINLATHFKQMTFHGIDLVERNLEDARASAIKAGVADRCTFEIGAQPSKDRQYDVVLAGEVLEHVVDWVELARKLLDCVKPGGLLIGTTPYGPWEAQGFVDEWPWRNHLHHIGLDDLAKVFGASLVKVQLAPYHTLPPGVVVGSYVFAVEKLDDIQLGLPDHTPATRPGQTQETLSVCMIVRSDGDSLAKTLRSVSYVADELVVGITDDKNGPAWEICKRFRAKAFRASNPLEAGFAASRNETVQQASGDWILWIDDDETLVWSSNLRKYLRNNMFDAYATPHHHFAVEPLGVLKTDMPTRLFRNRKGIRFFGEVHEHPEFGLNKGLGPVFPLSDVAIAHNGYETESVRRGRFMRNLPLMMRDREVNPDRELGKHLWLRDLAQMNRFDFEERRTVTPEMVKRANEAVALWRDMVHRSKNLRLALDGLPYYSECNGMLLGQNGIAANIALSINAKGLGDDMTQPPMEMRGLFASQEDLKALLSLLAEAKTQHLSSRY